MKVFGRVWTCSDAFGCVRMQSDAFRCVGKRFDTSGNFRIFPIFSDNFGDFWSVLDLGGLLLQTFYIYGGLLLLGLTIGRSHYSVGGSE